MLNKILVKMSTTNIHLLQFKLVTCNNHDNADFECRYIRTRTEEKPSKISSITFAILPFAIPSRPTFESTSLDETIRCASKWFILTQRTQKLDFVNLKCVTHNPFLCPSETFEVGGRLSGVCETI